MRVLLTLVLAMALTTLLVPLRDPTDRVDYASEELLIRRDVAGALRPHCPIRPTGQWRGPFVSGEGPPAPCHSPSPQS